MQDKYIIGLWNKTSQKGLQYCNGKIKINGITYKVVLFKNSSKKVKSHQIFQYYCQRYKHSVFI